MKKLGTALLCVGLGTLLAQTLGLGLLWSNGTLSRNTIAKIFAVIYGIEPRAPVTVAKSESDAADREQPSWAEIERARVLRMRQIEMREQALAAESSRLTAMQSTVTQDRGAFDQVKAAFEAQLKEDKEGALAEGRDRVRALWENMKAKQAKEQILQMYNGGDVDEVVRIYAGMAPNKQAKIAAEFKSPQESQVLAEITTAIRDGKPLTTTIDQAQQGLAPSAQGGSP